MSRKDLMNLKKAKKLTAMLLVLLMLLSAVPSTASATAYTGGDVLDFDSLQIGDTITGDYASVTGQSDGTPLKTPENSL